MAFRPRDKKPKVLPHKQDGTLADPKGAEEYTKELMAKLRHEQRLHEKQESFHVVRSGTRDVVVHLAVTILPRVNGHAVVGEREREFNQWCFELPARSLPVSNATAIKAFSELCHVGKQALMSLGLVKP